MSRDGRDIRAEERASYARLGPVRWRVLTAGRMLLAVLIALVAIFTFATVNSFHHGTGITRSSKEDRPAVAQVGDCARLGPVSADGFGYWWQCDIVVTAVDGRVVRTTVSESLVTPADRGRPVELVERCRRGNVDNCHYGTEPQVGWGLLLALLSLVQIFVVLLCALAVVIGSAMVIRGPDKHHARVDARRAKKQRRPGQGT